MIQQLKILAFLTVTTRRYQLNKCIPRFLANKLNVFMFYSMGGVILSPKLIVNNEIKKVNK